MSGFVIVCVVGLSALLVSVILFIISDISYRKLESLRKQCTVYAKATIVDVDTGSDGSSYYPVYEYSVDGQTIQSRCKKSSSKNCWKKGQVVGIFYNPQDVMTTYYIEFQTKTPRRLQQIGVGLIVLGVLWIIIGIIVNCNL